MGVLAYIPILLLGLTSLIDESTQVALPQATLFSKPDIPFSLGDPNSYRLPTIVRYTAPERAYSLFLDEASPNDEPTDIKVMYHYDFVITVTSYHKWYIYLQKVKYVAIMNHLMILISIVRL